MNIEEMRAIVAEITYEDYQFVIIEKNGLAFLQGRYVEPDIVTNDPSDQHTRKYYLSEHMVPSEIVQTALLLVKTSAEHRLREHFKFKGQRAYSPHFDVDLLVQLAKERGFDYRGKERK